MAKHISTLHIGHGLMGQIKTFHVAQCTLIRLFNIFLILKKYYLKVIESCQVWINCRENERDWSVFKKKRAISPTPLHFWRSSSLFPALFSSSPISKMYYYFKKSVGSVRSGFLGSQTPFAIVGDWFGWYFDCHY